MRALLVVAAFVWPMVLAAAVAADRPGGEPPAWTTGIRAATSWICHQRPERSFFSGAVQWPVCARCSGLYLAAPLGAVLALRRRRVVPGPEGPGLHPTEGAPGLQARGNAAVFAIAAAPTAIALGLEWLQLAPVSNVVRAAAAAPLGGVVAWLIVRAAEPPTETNRVH
jgi:hypothetical protein